MTNTTVSTNMTTSTRTTNTTTPKESTVSTLTVTGNLADEPEVRSVPSGEQVTQIVVIEKYRKKDEDGRWVDAIPNRFRVQAWGRLGVQVAESLHKGLTVDVVGHVTTSEWVDKETGAKCSSQTIVAESVGPTHPSSSGGVASRRPSLRP